MAVHLFTSLAILAFVVFAISAIIYEILDVICKDNDKVCYYLRLRIGSFHRFSDSLENITMFLIAGYIFDSSFINTYMSAYPKDLGNIILIACTIRFFSTSMISILNSFFVLWPSANRKDKE